MRAGEGAWGRRGRSSRAGGGGVTRDGPRRWIEAVERMQARPGAPVSCPDRGTDTPVTEGIRGEADPGSGPRVVRRTRRGRQVAMRVRFGRLASPPGA